jgi:hypothetical protein
MHIRFQKIKLFFRIFVPIYDYITSTDGMDMNIPAKLKNSICFACLLALPVGVYRGNPDSANVSLGAYGGIGQYAEIISSCDGESAKAKQKFTDVAGAASVRIPLTRNWNESPIILGLRAGTFRSTITPPGYSFSVPRPSTHFTYSYVNPNISFEFEDIGFGVGYLFKPMPDHFSDGVDHSAQASGHFRLGVPYRFYVLTDFNESLPIASGGGNYTGGIGFSIGKVSLFNGATIGHYYYPGLVHQLRLPLGASAAIDASFRWGSVEGIFEGGLSVGLVYQFGKPRH